MRALRAAAAGAVAPPPAALLPGVRGPLRLMSRGRSAWVGPAVARARAPVHGRAGHRVPAGPPRAAGRAARGARGRRRRRPGRPGGPTTADALLARVNDLWGQFRRHKWGKGVAAGDEGGDEDGDGDGGQSAATASAAGVAGDGDGDDAPSDEEMADYDPHAD